MNSRQFDKIEHQIVDAKNGQTGQEYDRRAELIVLTIIIIGALVLRVGLLSAPGFAGDAEYFSRWANALLTVPFGDFYSQTIDCEYLPGYIYLLALTAWLAQFVTGAIGAPQEFLVWVKLAAVISDLVIVMVVFRLCKQFMGSAHSLMAAGLIGFNPSVLFVSSIWGQVDSIACAFSMASLLTLLTKLPIAAAVLGGIAFTVKPQYALFLIVPGIAYLSLEMRKLSGLGEHVQLWKCWALRRILLPIIVALVTVEAILLPFSISIWPIPGARWTLYERLAIAAAKYDSVSVNAFNLWTSPIASFREPDSTLGWFGLSYQSWGFLLFATVVCV